MSKFSSQIKAKINAAAPKPASSNKPWLNLVLPHVASCTCEKCADRKDKKMTVTIQKVVDPGLQARIEAIKSTPRVTGTNRRMR